MPGRRHVPRGVHNGLMFAEDVNTVSRGIAPENFNYEQSVEAARKQGELELKVGTSAIRNEYQKRIADVSSLRSKAQHVLQTLEAERTNLVHVKDDVIALMRDFESTLQVNVDWVTLCKQQNQQLSSAAMKEHHTNIQATLDGSVKDVKHGLLALATQLQKLQRSIADVDAAIALLRADVVTKSGTMVVDKACMEGLLSSTKGAAQQRDAGASSGRGQSPRTALQQLSMPSPRRTDNDWQRTGQTATAHGLHVIDMCAPIRKASHDLVVDLRESGRLQRNPTVLDALRSQAKYGDHLDLQLELNKKAMQNQLTAIERQQAALSISLANVQEQLNLARQRLSMGGVRPAPEGTPMNVEEMLTIELAKLKRSEAELKGKLEGLSQNKIRTEAMVRTLGVQAAETRKTTNIAKACIDVKLPPISSASPRSQRRDLSTSPRVR